MTFLNTVRHWNAARNTRRELRRLDDRQLIDAGVPRWRIDAVSRGAPVEARFVV